MEQVTAMLIDQERVVCLRKLMTDACPSIEKILRNRGFGYEADRVREASELLRILCFPIASQIELELLRNEITAELASRNSVEERNIP